MKPEGAQMLGSRLRARLIRACRWENAAVLSRLVGASLGVLLLVVCGFGLVLSRQIGTDIVRADRSTTLADLYQDARYYATVEGGRLDSYRAEPNPVERQQYEQAARSLAATLTALGPLESTTREGASHIKISQLVVEHSGLRALTGQMLHLLDTGQVREATAVASTQIDPQEQRLISNLSKLEEKHHLLAVDALHRASVSGAWLRFGTPAALGLALLTLLGLAVVALGQLSAKRQALHDPLTGLPNRLLLADRARQALAAARRDGTRPVVMMLDLDRFKEVNDTLGHHHGDELLVQVAGRLAGALRPGDTVARFAGDEFALLLTEGGHEAGTRVAERIAEILEPPFYLDGVNVGVEASIGIAAAAQASPVGQREVASTAAEADELLRHADTAMYQAKADRRGYAHFVGGGDDNAMTHLALLGELRQALDHDELVVYYQPKVAADTGELVGVEALVRWQHPTRGLLAPAEFIGVAEGTTLIHRLTTVVVDKALQFSLSWFEQGIRIPVAVNVSARSFLDIGFPARIAVQLRAVGVPAELLCLELTESTVMADPDRALAILRELRAMGIKLSLDDFGTGYSSMSYLKILPVDELKVDRSFVRDVTSNDGDAVLARSAIDLGHNLGLTVVAEGVEDSATLVTLKTLGVDVIQGYYTGRPMPANLIGSWMTDRATLLGQTLHLPPDIRIGS